MAEWLVCETQNLLIAVGRRSNPIPSQIFANSRLIPIFLVELFRAALRLLASFAKRSFGSLYKLANSDQK